MRVYSSDLAEFQRKLLTNELFNDLESNYPKVVGHSAPARESNSWRASLPRLEAALRLAGLPPDVWVSAEERVPYFAKRIDAALFGYDAAGRPNMVIVGLKAWTEATALGDGNVRTRLGGNLVSEPHPSAQVGGYHEHLSDFCKALHSAAPVILSSCAYCHNYTGAIPDAGLFHPQFDNCRAHSPTFAARDAQAFADFLRARLSGGKGAQALAQFDREGLGPSKQLIAHAGEMITRQNVFRLLDEQLVANNAIVAAVRRAARGGRKRVILVHGGAGTGKSIIALNALGEVLRRDLRTYLVTGSAAFTNGVRKVLGRRLEGLIRFTDYFWNFSADDVDVLIVDEAHRIRARSTPRVPTAQRPQISQVEELIRAAWVSVFFADENQIISPMEIGEPAVIKAAAVAVGARFEEYRLRSQFRCNGSDAYLEWLDDLLEINASQGLKLAVPTGFDFKVVDSPHELLAEVRAKNVDLPNSARLVAGWCWPWSNPNSDGSLVEDIEIGDFRFPWEAKNGSSPAPGIPEAKWWAVDPAGVNQAGTVYSMQGFESPHVGVIVGPDLVVEGGRWIPAPKRNYSNALRRQPPELALPYIKRIYRTLLSRAMDSCSVYCTDEQTRDHIRSRIEFR